MNQNNYYSNDIIKGYEYFDLCNNCMNHFKNRKNGLQ